MIRGQMARMPAKGLNSMGQPQEIYQFRSHWFTDGRAERIVVKASEAWVFQFIPFSEFSPLFGGYARWHEPRTPTAHMPSHAIGVWGRRNVSKFRRILKERGATFTVVEGEGPEQHLSRQYCDYGERSQTGKTR